MNETLAKRVGRLVSGGFHVVMDVAEHFTPEAVMNENIREIERTIDDVRVELGQVLAQKHLAAKKLADENNRHENLSAHIQAALAAKRDDLASAGIAEQMDIEARVPVLENSIADCTAQEQELERFISALQAKKREMQQALHDWKQTAQAAGGGSASSPNGRLNDFAKRADASGNCFDRVLQRQGGMVPHTSPQAALLQELEQLSRNRQIAERLEQLKADQA